MKCYTQKYWTTPDIKKTEEQKQMHKSLNLKYSKNPY